ncbi:adenosine deaminase [Corynebacterium sp. 13CS0277]|uniref:adenosine deaminase n=1 Tax=Corynebacterium sp. 13CS0277 TaxID=2071994 RepID=UPI000D033E59|nr:adenosine deaminase [Corynebacterium sp. 13CS0277]PRQ11352.1 adenosine deaminase [Corynebacterium sp. 13CS0277]
MSTTDSPQHATDDHTHADHGHAHAHHGHTHADHVETREQEVAHVTSHLTPGAPLDEAIVHALPKVVLHDHLDGGLRPATIVELAAACGYEGLPTTDPEELGRWFVEAANSGSLPSYLECFDHTTAVMQTADALERVAREAVADLAADNVVYAELRFAPEQHQAQGMSLQEVMDAVIRGLAAGEEAAAAAGRPIVARLIVCGMRHADRTKEIAQLTIDNYGADSPGRGYVVAFDIAGAEDGFPATRHKEAFDLLRAAYVPFTVHAGEAAGIDSLAGALEVGAARLGHGARLYEDFSASLDGIDPGRLSSYVRDRRLALELCPTSNTQTGVVDDMADHPLPLLHQLGFAVTVNTDNRLLGDTTMTGEMMVLVRYFDYTLGSLYTLTLNAISQAFISELQREEISATLIEPTYARIGAALQGDLSDDTQDTPTGPELAQQMQLSEEELAGIDPAILEELGISLDDLGITGGTTPENS